MAPFTVVFLAVVVAPIGYAAYLSLYRNQLVGGNHFVGLSNLLDAVKDGNLQSSLIRVSLFLVVQVPIMIGLAAAAALAIDSGRLAGARLYRIGIFLPYAVPGVVATLMWGFMYGDQFGLVHSINRAWGWHLPACSPARGSSRRSATSSPGSTSATTCSSSTRRCA